MRPKIPVHTCMLAVIVLILAGQLAFAQESPELVYQKYSEAVRTKNLGELNNYLSSRQRHKLKDEAPEDRLKIIQLVAAFMPKSTRFTEKTISRDKQSATLRLIGVGGISGNDQVFGKVLMVKEKSEWKIDREEWSMNSH